MIVAGKNGLPRTVPTPREAPAAGVRVEILTAFRDTDTAAGVHRHSGETLNVPRKMHRRWAAMGRARKVKS